MMSLHSVGAQFHLACIILKKEKKKPHILVQHQQSNPSPFLFLILEMQLLVKIGRKDKHLERIFGYTKTSSEP